MATKATEQRRTPMWKQLSDDRAEVKLDYFLHFPNAFSQIELCLNDEQYSFYWRLFHLLVKSGGFLPYDVELIRIATKRKSRKMTERLLSAMLELNEFEIVTFADIPENFRNFLKRNEVFFEKNPKILKNRRVLELVLHGMKLHEKAVANGKAGGQKTKEQRHVYAKQGLNDSDSESDTESVKTTANNCLQNSDEKAKKTEADSGQTKLYGFAQFRNLWNEWALHYGVEQFELLTDKKRKLFNTRQKHFAGYGAEREQFWVELLSAVATYRNGFYVGNNDGVNHDGQAWRATFNWLFASDDNIEKFIKAVG